MLVTCSVMPDRIAAVLVLFACLAVAQQPAARPPDITGNWQGTEKFYAFEVRTLLHVWKANDGSLVGTLTYLDTGGEVQPVAAISVNESTVVFRTKKGGVPLSFVGSLNQNNSSIKGVWDGTTRKLDFRRVTLPKKESKAAHSDIDGYWVGRISDAVCPSATYVFHISKTSDGLIATWSVPRSGDYNWLATSVNRDGGSLEIELKQTAARFRGTINGQKTVIDGTWTQVSEGKDYPLVLKRTDHMPDPNPSEPLVCTINGMSGS
jgi:hypothetical protein